MVDIRIWVWIKIIYLRIILYKSVIYEAKSRKLSSFKEIATILLIVLSICEFSIHFLILLKCGTPLRWRLWLIV